MPLPPMQLHMVLDEPRHERLPSRPPPPGYTLRSYRPGDEIGVLRLLELAGFENWNMDRLSHYLQAPERITGSRVIGRHATLVAVTFASQETPVPRIGRLDYVTVDPGHRGLGLGLIACAAALGHLIDQGYPSIVLSTDDVRLPAIKTYLKLGFRPKILRRDMPRRWRTVLDRLAWAYPPDWLEPPPPQGRRT